jgi:hypothetical protein
MKVRRRMLKFAVLGGLLLLAGVLHFLASEDGRALLQRETFLGEKRQFCADGLSVQLADGWFVESLPDKQGWKAYLLGLTPADRLGTSTDRRAIQLREPATGRRVVISRTEGGADWASLLTQCEVTANCSRTVSPFLGGDHQFALAIRADDQIWYQHEFRRLLIAVHRGHAAGNVESPLPRIGAC